MRAMFPHATVVVVICTYGHMVQQTLDQHQNSPHCFCTLGEFGQLISYFILITHLFLLLCIMALIICPYV